MRASEVQEWQHIETATGGGAHEGEEEDLRIATTLIYANLDFASLSADTHKSGVHGVGVRVASAGVKLTSGGRDISFILRTSSALTRVTPRPPPAAAGAEV